MARWAIILGRQFLFSTEDEAVARRFMVIDGDFRVLDHSTGYYVYMDPQRSQAQDLILEESNEHKRT